MTEGLNKLAISERAYPYALRMLAENFKMKRVVRELNQLFPNDPEVTYHTVRRIKETRQDEIKALRQKLNDNLDDLWIADKRQRLVALQMMFEDANRWTPKTVLAKPGAPPVVVYDKNLGVMKDILKQARDELGGTPADRAADSLEALIKMAEESRGLQRTTGLEGLSDPGNTPALEGAQMIEIEAEYRTAGADEARGQLAGGAPVSDNTPVPDVGVGGDALRDELEHERVTTSDETE